MLLRRIGSKANIAGKIIRYFPNHDLYIDMFFGAGGLFFNKTKALSNIVNDIDDDVFNLFMVLIKRKDELIEGVKLMPKHQSLLRYWEKNKETDPIMKALRFLLISNYTYLGKGGTITFGTRHDTESLLKAIEATKEKLFGVQFMNVDFRKVIKNISFGHKEQEPKRAFIYADPPYVNTVNNYSDSFTEQDSIDLFDILTSSGIKFAMSEFDNPFIIEQAKQRNLNVIKIGERRTLKNRNTEILITNYVTNMLC